MPRVHLLLRSTPICTTGPLSLLLPDILDIAAYLDTSGGPCSARAQLAEPKPEPEPELEPEPEPESEPQP